MCSLISQMQCCYTQALELVAKKSINCVTTVSVELCNCPKISGDIHLVASKLATNCNKTSVFIVCLRGQLHRFCDQDILCQSNMRLLTFVYISMPLTETTTAVHTCHQNEHSDRRTLDQVNATSVFFCHPESTFSAYKIWIELLYLTYHFLQSEVVPRNIDWLHFSGGLGNMMLGVAKTFIIHTFLAIVSRDHSDHKHACFVSYKNPQLLMIVSQQNIEFSKIQ